MPNHLAKEHNSLHSNRPTSGNVIVKLQRYPILRIHFMQMINETYTHMRSLARARTHARARARAHTRTHSCAVIKQTRITIAINKSRITESRGLINREVSELNMRNISSKSCTREISDCKMCVWSINATSSSDARGFRPDTISIIKVDKTWAMVCPWPYCTFDYLC
jgi:hypothetical protein